MRAESPLSLSSVQVGELLRGVSVFVLAAYGWAKDWDGEGAGEDLEAAKVRWRDPELLEEESLD